MATVAEVFKKLFFNLFAVLAIYFTIFIFLLILPVSYILYGPVDDLYPADNGNGTSDATTPAGGTIPTGDSGSGWFTNLFNAILILYGAIPSVFFLISSYLYNGNPLTKPNRTKRNPDPARAIVESTRLEQVVPVTYRAIDTSDG